MPMKSSWMPRCSATARRCWKASEVEGALGSLARQDSSIQSLRAADDAAGQQVKRQARQVQLGLSSEFDGLDTQRAALASQADLIGAQVRACWRLRRCTAPWWRTAAGRG
jgi:hypothetical protein